MLKQAATERESADAPNVGWVNAGAASWVFALSASALWAFVAFRAFWETPQTYEHLKSLGVKIPLISQIWLKNYHAIGACCGLMAVVTLFKEILGRNVAWRLAANAGLMVMGCVLFTFAHWALSAPMEDFIQSLMERVGSSGGTGGGAP